MACLGRSQVGHIGQFQAGGGVMHVEAAGAFNPLAVDRGAGLEKDGVFELDQQACRAGDRRSADFDFNEHHFFGARVDDVVVHPH